ncbi:hypothetical protein F750_5848 [Streptomyces sp. PAMC 26508]|nr:hypothetical protein F750_5848 [Streptomyces sp. PAMC 26508]
MSPRALHRSSRIGRDPAGTQLTFSPPSEDPGRVPVPRCGK